MKCLLVGTGYSINTLKRHNTCLFFQEEARGLLIDCNGTCIQRLKSMGFPIENLDHVFLTHEHIDHIGALVNLGHQIWLKSSFYRPESRRTAPLHIYANARTVQMVQGLFRITGLSESPHLFPIIFHELNEAGGQIDINGFNIDYFPVRHGVTPCLGLCVQSGGKRIVYSADTEPVPVIYRHLRDGDVLIHECNNIDAPVNSAHTTWQQLETLLPSLPSVELYLVHLPDMSDEQETAFESFLIKAYQGRVKLGQDGAIIAT